MSLSPSVLVAHCPSGPEHQGRLQQTAVTSPREERMQRNSSCSVQPTSLARSSRTQTPSVCKAEAPSRAEQCGQALFWGCAARHSKLANGQGAAPSTAALAGMCSSWL